MAPITLEDDGANANKSAVLYFPSACKKSTPSPLSLSYYPSSTRHLSTLLPNQHREPSTLIEIDSAYCPQCFTSWDSNSAFNKAKGCCHSIVDGETQIGCVGCPICESILVLSVQEVHLYKNQLDKIHQNDDKEEDCTHLCFYECGYCQWNSVDDIGVCSKFSIMNNKEEGEKECTERSANDVKLQLTKLIHERQNDANPLFMKLLNGWNDKLKAEDMKRKSESLVSSSSRQKNVSIANTCTILYPKDVNIVKGESFSLEKLDDVILQKQNHIYNQVNESLLGDDVKALSNRLSISDLNDTSKDDDTQLQPPMGQYTLSSSNSYTQRSLLPVPVKLRTRAVRRDTIELSLGKPGILVKPKVNPLEGDSSLRYGQGQWYKKDSSAIHTVPMLTICKQSYNKDKSQNRLLIRVSNPTIGPIKLKIHTSFESIGRRQEEDSLLSTIIPSTYQNLIVNLFPLQMVQSKVIFPKTKTKKNSVMQSILLEPIEDSFLELGSGGGGKDAANKLIANKIKEWEDGINWADHDDDEKKSDCNLIFQHKDVAFVEFMVHSIDDDDNDKESVQQYLSTPLMLEIEVSEESWESSLIQEKTKDGEKDCVSFMVLPTWKKKRETNK